MQGSMKKLIMLGSMLMFPTWTMAMANVDTTGLYGSQTLNIQKNAQVLVVTINKVPSAKGIITGKIFEYLKAKRPILAIGPTDGDLAEIIA